VSFGRAKAVCAPFEENLGGRAYTGEKLAGWCKEQGGWELEIAERNADTEGFIVLPHRWIVERTLGWLIRNRRLSKDYERKVQSSETFIKVAMIRLILRRLARGE
jgi:putative transposase